MTPYTTYNTKIGKILIERIDNVTSIKRISYIAMIADRKTQYGSGHTILAAIGDLLITHFSED